MKRFIRYWMPVILYAGLIFTVSSFPLPPPKVEIPFIDKFIHLVEYGILGFLFYRALKVSKFPPLPKADSPLAKKAPPEADQPRAGDQPLAEAKVFILAIIFSIFYALSDELHQSFVPGRNCDLWDLAADSLGVVLVALYLRYRERLARRTDKG